MAMSIGLKQSGIGRHRGIDYVGSASVQLTGTGSSGTVAYSPTEGNYVCVFVGNVFYSLGTVTCADSGSNALTAGPIVTNDITYSWSFYYKVPTTGVTSVTVSWTSAVSLNGWITLAEYTNVASVNTSLSGATHTGTSTNPNITCTTLVNNSWLIAGLISSSGPSNWFSPTGNKRISNAGFAGTAIMDNTVQIAGNVACGIYTTPNSTYWTAIALELDPVG